MEVWQVDDACWMSSFAHLLTVLYLVSLIASGVSEEVRPSRGHSFPAASALADLNGREANVFQSVDARFLVFLFVRTDCPVSNSYAPEVRRLFEKFSPQRVAFWLVYTDPDESPTQIRRHLAAYGYPCDALRDPGHLFARRSRVQVTPEAALYKRNGELLYHGRIDNRYVSFGQARPEATKFDLKNALEAALAGKPVTKPSGSAVGCFIEGVK